MKHHPFADIWPLRSGKDYDDLKADIAANGLRMPVLTYKDQVLDGRHRERACEELGMAARYEPSVATTDQQALTLVVSLNLHRRHLSLEERALASARLANIMRGGDRKSIKVSTDTLISPDTDRNHHSVSIIAAAKLMNVSVASTKRARAILAHGTPADIAEVESGKTSLMAKCNEVRPKRDEKPQAPPAKRPGPGRPRKHENNVIRFDGSHPKYLAPHEVDPEFKGTATEFVDKYGHVQVRTAEEYATMRFSDVASDMRAIVKRCRELPESPRPVDPHWLRSPKPYDVAKLTEAMEYVEKYLEPKIAEAKMLLACAVAALKKKAEAS